MGGIGAEGAFGAAGTYQGLQDWMRGRRQQVVEGQQDADRVRTQSIQDQEMALAKQELLRQHARQDTADARAGTVFDQNQADRTAGIAAEQTGAQHKAELVQQIKALGLPKMAEIGALITVEKGGQLPPQLFEMLKPKTPHVAFAPNGRAVDMNDPSILGQNFAAPKEHAAPGAEPVVKVETMENGQPVTKYLPQSQVVGKTFGKPSTGAGPVVPAAMREKLVNADVGESLITQLQGLYEDHTDPKTGQTIQGAKHLIGPVQGRLRGFGQSVGVGINPTFAEFKAASARLKNATIQAITGSAMGVEEAKRIIDEIPTEDDPPELWPIKAKQSLKNIANIRSAISTQAGGSPAATGGGPSPGERRSINGVDAEWDGHGWLPVGG